jgi:pyrimidine deaminase RibD-like protein
MEEELNIRKLVKEFFAWQVIKFSEIWKDDVTSRVELFFKNKDSFSEEQVRFEIANTHYIKIIEIREKTKKWLKTKLPVLSQYQIEYSVDEALDVFFRNFDAAENENSDNPELHYLQRGAWFKALTRIRRDSVEVGDILINIESLEDFPGFDPKSEDFTFDEEPKIKTKIFGNKRISEISARETFRYYSMFNLVKAPKSEGGRPLPNTPLKHKKKTLEGIHKDYLPSTHFELSNLNSETKYYKKRWKLIRFANERKLMELAISKLRESMEKKISDLLELKDDEIETKNEIEKAPLLSSVLVTADEQIFASYKGEDLKINPEKIEGNKTPWSKHCEYSLFVEVVKENKVLTEGSTLYVTLEPCNSRKPIKNSDPREPKIPCAVRCVEAGIKKIYIGSLDYNKGVFGKGHRILQTGEYKFDLDENQKHKGKNETEIEGSQLLEEYFKSKGKNYPLIFSNNQCRIYKIGKSVDVSFFDDDLMLEINNLNAKFQSEYIKNAYKDE